MFKGEESVQLRGGLSDEQLKTKIEEVLGDLGRVRVDNRGGIQIEPRDKFSSFLTDVTMEGQMRKRSDGVEVSVSYNCKPSAANWAIMVAGTLLFCIGWVTIFVPMMAKGEISKAVKGALANLEDAFSKR